MKLRGKSRRFLGFAVCQSGSTLSRSKIKPSEHTVPASLATRQIHLDFHTGPWIPGIGSEFDADVFGDMMKDAHVNSVTLFAKCHHGHLYYNTDHPARHPGLKKGFDLLAKQVDALHKRNIRAPIYLSVQCDEWAANAHPEWIALRPDATRVGRAPLAGDKFSWQILDMSSPYQDFLYEQTTEVLKLFKPVDGLFFDMCWDQISVSNWAKAGMVKKGLDPVLEADRKQYANDVAIAYMKRFYKLVKQYSPQGKCYFNSRPLWNMAHEAPMLSQIEIEALPTGGWGYMYFPTNVRFARNFARPYLGMTARFHKSWADFGGLKPYAALEYEIAQMMAHGAQCSVGDQLHPRGTLDKGAYELIGQVYKRVEEREPWLENAKPVTQIGVLLVDDGSDKKATGNPREGWTRLLTQLKHQFDIVLADARFEKYDLIVLPDIAKIDAQLSKKLDAYVKQGGAVLATGYSGLNDDATALTWKSLPVVPHGISLFETTYMRFGKPISDDVPDSDHVLYDTTVRVTPAKGAKALGSIVEPYFERRWDHFSSHAQTPTDKVSQYALATIKGKIAHIAAPVFGSFAKNGNYPLRLLVRNVIELLIEAPLLRVAAPTSTEATVMRQKNRTIVHLLQYCPERRTKELDLVEDIVPLYDVPMSLASSKAPKKVYLAPEMDAIEFEHLAGRVNLRVPKVNGHAMVVFE